MDNNKKKIIFEPVLSPKEDSNNNFSSQRDIGE
jgi:hypothetical protein